VQDARRTRFIGVDLAWQSDRNNTGLVVAEGNAECDEVAMYYFSFVAAGNEVFGDVETGYIVVPKPRG
jgi:predicted RNase H-like nuclease